MATAEIELLGEAANGLEAIDRARELHPDMMLMDLMMPRMNGIEAIQIIKKEMPDIRILVITSYAEDDKVFAAIKAGAHGYLLKDTAPEDLIRAIRDVHQGKSFLHPSIALRVIQEISQPSSLPPVEEPLTEREVEVLKLVAQGMTNLNMAELLEISERTVGTHISNILNKLHLANRTQAALYALRTGIANLYSNQDGDQ